MSPARRKPDNPNAGLVDFGETARVTDPAVSALLSQGERRKVEAHLPQKERERKRKEREKIRSRRAGHTTYDIPPELRRRIKDLSEQEGVPASQLATLALLRFVQDLERGAVELSAYKTRSNSPRYDYNLDLPEELLKVMVKRGKR